MQRVIKTSKDKAKVRGNRLERWRGFQDGLREDIRNGTLRVVDDEGPEAARAQGGGEPCGEFCEGHGGVDICGEFVVLCKDGTSGVREA